MMYNGYALKAYVETATRLYFNYYWTAHNIGDLFVADFEKLKIDLFGMTDELYTNAEITIVSRCKVNQPRFDIILKDDDVYKLSIDWTYAGRYGDDHIEKFALFKNGKVINMNEDIDWKIADALHKTATRCLVRPDEFDKRN